MDEIPTANLFDLVYAKSEVTSLIQTETDRALTAEALKLDSAAIGADNGVAPLVNGLILSSDIDWANNTEAIDATSTTVVMSPLRTQEQFNNNLVAKTGLVSVNVGAPQVNTLNIVYSKLTYFDTTLININGHFTVNASNQEITINTAGIYQLVGAIEFEADIDTTIELATYINGTRSDVILSGVGRGTGKPVSITYNTFITLAIDDVFTIYGGAESDSTNISITASTVSLEKTIHE